VISDDGVSKNGIMGLLMLDNITDSFKEDVQEGGIGFFCEQERWGAH